VWQTINVEHECHYCVPAHTGIAKMMKVDDAIAEALRNETPLEDPKLEALRSLTLKIVRNRGNVTQKDLDVFYDAGYGERQVLDIILGLSQKTISNYVNHIANTPVDENFKKFDWTKKNSAS
jgi:alkylhydroperoxidase family enzyme